MASNHRLVRSLHGHPSAPAVLAQVAAEEHTIAPASKRFNHRMGQHGLIFCQQG